MLYILTIWRQAKITWLDGREHRFIRKVLNWFPVILFAYVVPALITWLCGFDFSAIVLHQWSRDLIMPLAILTVMSALSFRQLKIIGSVLLFAIGSLAMTVVSILKYGVNGQESFSGNYS